MSAPSPTELPMFPLGTVLLPGAALPLHVFEPRYRALVRTCLATTPEFGVVLIERGSEVGGGDTRFGTGCVARILRADELEDGRWVLATVGARRIRVVEWLADGPYPRALVEDWPDEPLREPATEAGARVLRAREQLRRVLGLAAEAGLAVPAIAADAMATEPVAASYELSALAPIGPLDRLRLLEAGGPRERLERLVTLLVEQEALLGGRPEG